MVHIIVHHSHKWAKYASIQHSIMLSLLSPCHAYHPALKPYYLITSLVLLTPLIVEIPLHCGRGQWSQLSCDRYSSRVLDYTCLFCPSPYKLYYSFYEWHVIYEWRRQTLYLSVHQRSYFTYNGYEVGESWQPCKAGQKRLGISFWDELSYSPGNSRFSSKMSFAKSWQQNKVYSSY